MSVPQQVTSVMGYEIEGFLLVVVGTDVDVRVDAKTPTRKLRT